MRMTGTAADEHENEGEVASIQYIQQNNSSDLRRGMRATVGSAAPIRGTVEDRFFAPESVRAVTEAVNAGLDAEFPDHSFHVAPHIIRDAMDSVFSASTPSEIGGISTRGTVELRGARTADYFYTLLDRTAHAVIRRVADERMMIENNEKLSAWDTVLGDSNRHGLRAHQTIKLDERRPPSLISMRY